MQIKDAPFRTKEERLAAEMEKLASEAKAQADKGSPMADPTTLLQTLSQEAGAHASASTPVGLEESPVVKVTPTSIGKEASPSIVLPFETSTTADEPSAMSSADRPKPLIQEVGRRHTELETLVFCTVTR